MPIFHLPSRFHGRNGILLLVVVCVCALTVEWVVLTTYIFPASPGPYGSFESWSPYAEEYYILSWSWVGSAYAPYMKSIAEEIAEQTDRIINIADVREATCHVWIERGWCMPTPEVIDDAIANGLESNSTIVPNSIIDTMEKAYLALEITEYAFDCESEPILELIALDEQ